MSEIVHVNEANYADVIVKAAGAVFLACGADWCPTCRMMSPLYAKLAAEYDGKAIFAHCDIDESPVLKDRLAIRSVPTIFAFKNGTVVEALTQVGDPKEFMAFINRHL